MIGPLIGTPMNHRIGVATPISKIVIIAEKIKTNTARERKLFESSIGGNSLFIVFFRITSELTGRAVLPD